MAPEQYSTPGRKAIDHALNKRLVFDIIRYQKSSLAMTSCDLKSCYDRIVHVPATMAMFWAGASAEPVSSMFSTIENTMHTTRTAYGDSSKKYGGQENYRAPIMGVGQGNGCGPQVWAAVSSAMFEVMRKRGLTTHFCLPITKESLSLCGFSYVDDTDLIQAMGTTSTSNNPEETIQKMQESVDCWEGVATSTGGAIATDKSWWYIIHFDWNNGKWSYGNLDFLLNDSLTCRDKDGVRQELKFIPANQAVEMLGVYLAPDGNNKAQFGKMKKQAQYYGEIIRTGHVDRHETWTTLTKVAMKALEYSLPAMTLTEDECTSIMWPLLQASLPRSGVNQYFPRDVLYSKASLNGVGLKNLFLTQGIAHLSDIVSNLWSKTITGHLITQCLEHLRLEIGVSGNILQLDYYQHQPLILTSSWIENTWQFFTDFGIHLNPNITEIPMRREFNNVRLFKGITTCIQY